MPARTKAADNSDATPWLMPPETYDSVWPAPGEVKFAHQYLTSDQCLGCHSAGGTGLQFDMTQPGTDTKLINISPYGTWRGSPMGLAGEITGFTPAGNAWVRFARRLRTSWRASL